LTHQVWHHCGGVGDEVDEITLTSGEHSKQLKKYSRLNLAIAFNSHGLTDQQIEKANKKIMKYREKIYEAVAQAGEQIHAYPPTEADWY
jgi:hypothetical protein